MRRHIAIALCMCHMITYAQHLPDPLLSPLVGMSGYSMSQADVFAVLSNPAATAQTSHFTAGVYGERKYLLRGVQQFCGVVQFPLQGSGAGLELDYLGSTFMNEVAMGFMYGRRLGAKMEAGVRFRYYRLNVSGHVQASALWAEAGCLFKLSEKIKTGFSFSRSTKQEIQSDEPSLTQVYRMGLGYEASSRLYIAAEWIKQTSRDLQGNMLVLYSFEEGLRIRMGWQTYTSQPVVGAGLYWKHCWTDILVSYHPYLGFTPALQMIYAPGQKRKNKS